ncbi:MAG: mechanosensitive ion channel [Candidatus Omnitrophica bacterium]|nr:mechanosensitive ion channel [Candidatus Omnitrophota bacterium]
MEEVFSKIYEYLVTYGFNLLAAVLIFIVGRWVASLVTTIIEGVMKKAGVEQTLVSFMHHIVFFGMMVFVIIASLNKLGVQTASIIAVLGAAGLAVGLALQGSLANFAAGVMLIIFKPFKVGDFVKTGGAEGIVLEIQIFNTALKTLDNSRVIIPNSKITEDKIINYSILKKRRVDLVFGISYDDDIATAKAALQDVVKKDKRILANPQPTIAVAELGDSSVNLVCRPWVKPADYWDVYFDVTEKGKIELEKKGCTIPFPQRDVHMYNTK